MTPRPTKPFHPSFVRLSKLCVPGPSRSGRQIFASVKIGTLFFPLNSIFRKNQLESRFLLPAKCEHRCHSFWCLFFFWRAPFSPELGDHFHLIKAIERKVAKDMANMALINPFFFVGENLFLCAGGWLVGGVSISCRKLWKSRINS